MCYTMVGSPTGHSATSDTLRRAFILDCIDLSLSTKDLVQPTSLLPDCDGQRESLWGQSGILPLMNNARPW